ncbi:glutathione peroxidase [Vibrio sp. L5-1]|uniref:Glutathione peroxidase n=1 Tax=Vibrio splendidus TaxID=29497 RepID=A0A7Y4D7V1_VIBSP|nr:MULTISPECIES: glutathione peroxidase [Vibrio]MCF7495456.1 glutathione peroxidase [Vibrio sp. L5-1]NOJ13678.1 glutathione peroxidase [Vibrio splendidus]TVU64207.1 glutathione peroxidase [Vibrio atlanticus]
MKSSLLCSTALIASLTSSIAFASSCPEILNGKQRLLNSNEEIELCEEFQGKTLLVVNTASQCGFTPQFEQLEQLHQTYKDQGFTVVGFPSNDFRQDRGSEEKSAKICYLDYGVTFPMMARASLSGSSANPVFAEIQQQAGVTPKWNFYKFLINKEGKVVATFPSSTSPVSATLKNAIEQQL